MAGWRPRVDVNRNATPRELQETRGTPARKKERSEYVTMCQNWMFPNYGGKKGNIYTYVYIYYIYTFVVVWRLIQTLERLSQSNNDSSKFFVPTQLTAPLPQEVYTCFGRDYYKTANKKIKPGDSNTTHLFWQNIISDTAEFVLKWTN